MITWEEIELAVLAKSPKAKPFLDILATHWGDGKLTEAIADRFIGSFMAGNFIEAKRLIYAESDADTIIAADRAENAALAQMIAGDQTIYDFAQDFLALLLKIALGAALASVNS